MKGHPRAVRECLQKARDSALLAVEVYNKPAVSFKSAGYITLMVIAWTALLHAVFFKRKGKPFYRKPSGRFVKVDGDRKHWELDECLRQYFGNDTQNAIRRNLEFFIPLRNKIEHRSLPELDSSIFGECQAMLLNFDEVMAKEFGPKYCLRECLAFSLQLFPSAENLVEAVRRNKSAQAAVDFIQQYRSSLTTEVLQSGKFAFKAFLIQVANHQSQDALAIQFRNFDRLTDDEKQEVGKLVALVRLKPVTVANADTIRAGEVIRQVAEQLGNPTVARGGKQVPKFNQDWHQRCWKKWKVRPPTRSPHPEETDLRYCIYDRRHNDYGYTQAWVKLLAETFKDDAEYRRLYEPAAPAVAT